MGGATTEGLLRDWRFGQTLAERLAAALLQLEGYRDVDPQHPLGGPDGLKDVLCRRNGVRWVAAAYFPTTPVTFSAIKKKFGEDVRGVAANGASGFAFFVNQRLSDTERKKLKATSPAPHNQIYHVERMVHLLNSARGAGLRREYLGIEMTTEETWAFQSAMNADVERRLEFLHGAVGRVDARTRLIAKDIKELPSTIGLRPRLGGVDEPPTSTLTVAQVCWLHRIVTDGSGLVESARGRLREVDGIWIGSEDGPEAAGNVVPLPAAEVEGALTALLDWWQGNHPTLRDAASDEIATSLADFHHRFFIIHPFIDGNGRLARLLLDQAARELLGKGIGRQFTRPPTEYYQTLAAANDGDLGPLSRRILDMLEEEEEATN